MYVKFFILFILILIASFLNIMLLRFLIKKRISNYDYRSNNKYTITDNKLHLLINTFSMEVWLVENIKSDSEWIKIKNTIPRYWFPHVAYSSLDHIVLHNSPDSQKIINKKISSHNSILLSKILSIKYNLKKNYMKFVLYLSSDFSLKKNIIYEKNKKYVQILENSRKNNIKSNKKYSKYIPQHECIEIIKDFKNKNVYLKTKYSSKRSDKNINELCYEIDNSIPLYSYWKTLLVIIFFIISYIIRII